MTFKITFLALNKSTSLRVLTTDYSMQRHTQTFKTQNLMVNQGTALQAGMRSMSLLSHALTGEMNTGRIVKWD